MQKESDETSLTLVLMFLSVIFIVHIIFGALLYVVTKVALVLWQRNKKYRTILVTLFALPFLWGVLEILVAPEQFSTLWMNLYIHLLDQLTGAFYEYTMLSANASFRVARFLIRLAPMSLLVTAGLWLREFWINRKKMNLEKPIEVNVEFPSGHELQCLRQSDKGAFIGMNDKKKPIHLTDYQRGMHTQVIGATGFGKTTSVLMPLLMNDIRGGKSVIFIDGKGDKEALASFLAIVREAGREHDAYIFAPAFPNISNSWNPLGSGNAVVQKDRIVGAQIWTEEHYKKIGEELLLRIFYIFDDLKIVPSFPKLSEFLKNPSTVLENGRKFRDPKVKQDYLNVKETLQKNAKNYSGIIADIGLFSESFLKPLFIDGREDEIKLRDIVRENKIVYFSLPVLMMEETMKRIARMVIHDLKIVCSDIQNYKNSSDRPPVSIFIDEFASFASQNFVELLNKARSAGIGITIIHQSMGDIESIDKNFARQIFENTNIKVVLRVDDPATIEQYARMAGTHQEMKYTYQTVSNILGRNESGGASMREVDVFNVDPNTFRNLRVGEAVVMIKNLREFHKVKLDYLELPQEDLSDYTKDAENLVMKGVKDLADLQVAPDESPQKIEVFSQPQSEPLEVIPEKSSQKPMRIKKRKTDLIEDFLSHSPDASS